MIQHYLVISASSAKELEEKVNEKINDHYVPYAQLQVFNKKLVVAMVSIRVLNMSNGVKDEK